MVASKYKKTMLDQTPIKNRNALTPIKDMENNSYKINTPL